MGCVAQMLGTPQSAVVSQVHCCCDNIVTTVNPISISMVNINVAILRGTVNCEDNDRDPNNNQPVAGAIVVASYTDGNNAIHYYAGITNDAGEYSICVPAPTDETTAITYSVEAYKCCCSDTSTPTDCNCCTNGSGA